MLQNSGICGAENDEISEIAVAVEFEVGARLSLRNELAGISPALQCPSQPDLER